MKILVGILSVVTVGLVGFNVVMMSGMGDLEEEVVLLQAENDELKSEAAELAGPPEDLDEDAGDADDEDSDDSEEVAEQEEDDEYDEPTPPPVYTGQNFIMLTSPSPEASFHEEPIAFKGKVSPNTTKIVVEADNALSQGPEDLYTLQSFDYGDGTFAYNAKKDWNNLYAGTNEYVFTAYFDDGTTGTASISIFYIEGGAEMAKPVIYLYPEEDMKISVNVEPTGGFTVTEPAIRENGWEVFAKTNGRMFSLDDFRVYPYLFWEGFAVNYETPREGFVMKRDEVSGFFDEKLSYLGMNEVEIRDFKEYWMRNLADDPYYYITFIPQETFDRYAPLSVTPEPDSVIRVIFDYKGLEKPIEVEEQRLEPGVREGFTVVEWGGRMY